MMIHFTKMQGLGNDFMVLDGVNQPIHLSAKIIKTLAHRHTGVGFDQLLLVEPSMQEGIDFNYRIFNADGQEVGQCGNGARCLALFVKHRGLTEKNHLTVATKTTVMNLHINENDSVTVDMGVPQLNPENIPLLALTQHETYPLLLKNHETIHVHAISLGNPHAVLIVDDIKIAPVETIGQQISEHPLFPQQTNVGFMQIINAHEVKLRVYERGCGETLACGSGAVAAAAIGRLFYGLAAQIQLELLGGNLIVDWPNMNGPIYLTGPAVLVYEGQISIN